MDSAALPGPVMAPSMEGVSAMVEATVGAAVSGEVSGRGLAEAVLMEEGSAGEPFIRWVKDRMVQPMVGLTQ